MTDKIKRNLRIGNWAGVNPVKPYVIAEVGSNWHSLGDCLTSVRMAAWAGASAVKFQSYTHEELYGVPGYVQHVLPPEWIPEIAAACDKHAVDFLCTTFSAKRLAEINPLVKATKISSSDNTVPALLRAAVETGKPLLLSTGASNVADIRQALAVINEDLPATAAFSTTIPVVLLYCNAAYPSITHDLAGIAHLAKQFPECHVGYSCHALDIYASLAAWRHYGAVVIEKHVRLAEIVGTPDSRHSIDFEHLKLMTAALDQWSGELMTGEEKTFINQHNRRLIANQDIAKGDTLLEGTNFGAFRSKTDDTNGLSPMTAHIVSGRKAALDIKQGDSIGPESF